METERTHWDGCWKSSAHHACAVAEIARLQAVVAKLPKDAEGVPITEGSTRYIRRTAGNGSFPVEVVGLDVRVRYPDGHISRENPERLHSTRQAAEAAETADEA